MSEEKKYEESAIAPAPSTYWEDHQLAPQYSRWKDDKGRLFIIIRALYPILPGDSTEAAGCREIHLLNVETETCEEMEFHVFKRYVNKKLLMRVK